jgi:Rrf2 family protein
MLRLSKKSEYALMAIQYIASCDGRVVSAKEIAEKYDISFEFVSKALQSLMRGKFIASQQGAGGGYVLLREPTTISVAEILEAIEGKQKLVECCGEHGEKACSMHGRCTIRTPMAIIQHRLEEVLTSMSIAQMAFPEQIVHQERFVVLQSATSQYATSTSN